MLAAAQHLPGFLGDVLHPRGMDEVRFIDDNDERDFAGVQHVHETLVLAAHAFAGIEGQQGHVGLAGGLDG